MHELQAEGSLPYEHDPDEHDKWHAAQILLISGTIIIRLKNIFLQ